MVLDRLDNAGRYQALHPRFARAFAFLREAAAQSLPVGRHVIDGDALFAIVSDEPGRGRAAATRESHRRMIDIQYVESGCDEIGWKPTAECNGALGPYDAAKDCTLYTDEPEAWVTVAAGSLMILWPEDMHAPMGGEGAMRKIVVKVAVDG